jgi:hypothetical protein
LTVIMVFLAMKEVGRKASIRVLWYENDLTDHGQVSICKGEPKRAQGLSQLKRQGNRLFPRASRKECSPTNTWILAQWNPVQTSNLQNCKFISFCCFKALNVWQFVIAAMRKYDTLFFFKYFRSFPEHTLIYYRKTTSCYCRSFLENS